MKLIIKFYFLFEGSKEINNSHDCIRIGNSFTNAYYRKLEDLVFIIVDFKTIII
jgi:hypothetical protein